MWDSVFAEAAGAQGGRRSAGGHGGGGRLNLGGAGGQGHPGHRRISPLFLYERVHTA